MANHLPLVMQLKEVKHSQCDSELTGKFLVIIANIVMDVLQTQAAAGCKSRSRLKWLQAQMNPLPVRQRAPFHEKNRDSKNSLKTSLIHCHGPHLHNAEKSIFWASNKW